MKRCVWLMILILVVSAGGLCGLNAAGIEDLADDSARVSGEELQKEQNKKIDFALHGFVRTNIVGEKTDNYFNKDIDFRKSGVILQLQLEGYAMDIAHLYSAVNFELNTLNIEQVQDDLYNVGSYLEAVPFIRFVEAYLDLYPAKWMSIRAGHQIITWGEIEGIEAPTDILTPWNYATTSSVFEDSRMANTALALNFFFVNQKLELVWIPIFQPSQLPKKDIIDKGHTEYFSVVPKVVRPDMNIKNCEYAARISGLIGSNFKYGVAFLYGFDDLPDSEVVYEIRDSGGSGLFSPDYGTVEAYLVYRRIMIPTLDLAYDIKDKVTLKSSTALFMTDDFKGVRDDHRNSYVKYLVGVESTNIGADIYLGLYVGQHWVINYTEEHGMRSTTDPMDNNNLMPNNYMMDGFDERYEYKWLISGLIQRSFLQQKNFDIGVRWALSASPEWNAVDYIVNVNFDWRITDGVRTTVGFVFADKIGVIKNLGIIEFQYSF